MVESQDFFSLVQDASVVDGDLLSWVCVLSLAFLRFNSYQFYTCQNMLRTRKVFTLHLFLPYSYPFPFFFLLLKGVNGDKWRLGLLFI